MPKKSDRREHESAMSSLLPEVSLDEQDKSEHSETEETGTKERSSTELQNSSGTEQKNYSSTRKSSAHTASSEEGGEDRPSIGQERKLPVRPTDRPNLEQKLGPYVSTDVDDALEDAYLLLRRQFGGEVSKSLIVEASLRFVLNDYLRRGEDSEVAMWLENVLQTGEKQK